MEGRRRFAVALNAAFGSTPAVWGNGWERFGIAAHPMSEAPRNAYRVRRLTSAHLDWAFDNVALSRNFDRIVTATPG